MCIIRRLKMGEAQLFKDVRLEALRESPNAFSSRLADAMSRSDESWCEQADASAMGCNRATFIMLDDQPVGLAALYRCEDASDEGELIQMWIAPEKRGGSAATKLIDEIFRWAVANGFSRVRAEVLNTNSRALRFYEKIGFTKSKNQSNHSASSVVLTKVVEQAVEPNS